MGDKNMDFCRAITFLSLLCLLAGSAQSRDYKAGILAVEDEALVDALNTQLQGAGYSTVLLAPSDLSDQSDLSDCDVLVLSDSSSLPAKSTQSIEAYLKAGGDIIALNAPLWQRALIHIGDLWITREDFQRENAGKLPEHAVFDFKDISGWQRGSNSMEEPVSAETIANGPISGERALHVFISNLTSYDTFRSPDLQNPFPKGHTLTVFSAKGDERTTQLAVEWAEKDGSRWIATVALTPEWRQYVLTPDDFTYWISIPNRGGRGDHLHPENAVSMSVGLAHTHTTTIGSGRFEYWVGPFGTSAMTPELQEYLSATVPPALDTLSPGYKFFDCSDVSSLKVRADQAIVGQADFPIPAIVRSPHPRPKGGGFDKGRDWRWIPLVEARTGSGEWRGTPVTMMVHANGPYKGSVWASFGIGDMDWYKSPAVLSMIGQIAERMKNPVWIIDGGTNFYTYFENQEVKGGVRVVNLGEESTNVQAKVATKLHDESWRIALLPGEAKTVYATCTPPIWPKGGCVATAQLIQDGKVIDKVSHELNVWYPKRGKHFVTIKDGDFMLDGKPWKPHGVNYMPSSGIGTEDGEYFEHYLSTGSYDPEVFQRDLEHIKDLGYTAVSIFIYSGHEKAQNLVDLLRRLENLGLKANLSLRPGTPMDFNWPQIGDIIKNSRLNENDTIFAYDLAWEPMFGTHDDRKPWDAEWEKWIVERYGSVANAEKDWGFSVPREDGKITNPLPDQIDSDGEWRRMSAAYRRFLDTLLYKKYSAARRLIRSVDPNHLVSFRMAEAANPNYRWDGRIPYDFPYLAAAVDFLAPEAYGRIGDWEKVKPGWFEYEYARWAAPQKPMIWAEQGTSTWEMSRMWSSPVRLEYQAMCYNAFYRMLISSGADGLFSWWYPGGFRVGENSDYGVINSDGSDRAVTKVIRENGPKFLASSAKPTDYWITIDRDAHPDGLAGIYDEVKAEFWDAIDKGLTPGLRTAGTGTDSSNCPLVAVGNTPCNGTNPPKYLDAAIDVVEVSGKSMRIEFTNLGEAELLSKNVNLLVNGVKTPLPHDVAHLESAVIKNVAVPQASQVTITFEAEGRTPFGEKYQIVLLPGGG